MVVQRQEKQAQKQTRRLRVNKKLDFKYTLDDFYREVIENLAGDETERPADKTAKPNALEMLKSKAGLNKVRNERI